MDIRLYFPPRPGFPPSTVIVLGVPDDADQGSVETLARKVLDARAVAPYMGRIGWAEIEGAGQRLGISGVRKAQPSKRKSAPKKGQARRRKKG